MTFGLFVLGILFLVVVAPLWILAHYLTRWRSARGLSVEDERALGELWNAAQRMEARLANLERALDAETPGWQAETEADRR
ncbi:MAG: envelope stress response membrane protein PspB [Acetobacteraceae bacterium]